MTDSTRPSGARARYGIDAPRVFAVFVVALLAMGTFAAISGRRPALVGTALFGFCVGTWWHATRRGKFVVWDGVLDALALRGDERVLDLGCGRGAVLLAAARRLPRGRAIGIDLWSTEDQSGNAQSATQANAQAEGVADRIELHTGDMRALPLPDASVDVVVSSLAIHNIPDAAGRAQAIAEALRVLRPGGRLRLADIDKSAEYERELAARGALDVRRRDLGWRMWWGGPFMRTYLVEARKA
jgi:ubiquinone/menaquinone biosynthesis C-methylase UbiE